MDIIKYFSTLGDSVFMGRPYKINRLLFLFLSLIVIIFVAFTWIEAKQYVYVECNKDARGSCSNVLYGSDFCKKNLDFKDKDVCTSERIPINETTKKGSLGIPAPWYVDNYTEVIIGLYLIVLLINTLLYNRHLFHKPDANEPKVKDFVIDIIKIGNDGEAINDGEDNKDKSEEREGKVSDSGIYKDSSEQPGNSRSSEEVKPSSEGSVKNSLEQNEVPSRDRTRGRFRKRDTTNEI